MPNAAARVLYTHWRLHIFTRKPHRSVSRRSGPPVRCVRPIGRLGFVAASLACIWPHPSGQRSCGYFISFPLGDNDTHHRAALHTFDGHAVYTAMAGGAETTLVVALVCALIFVIVAGALVIAAVVQSNASGVPMQWDGLTISATVFAGLTVIALIVAAVSKASEGDSAPSPVPTTSSGELGCGYVQEPPTAYVDPFASPSASLGDEDVLGHHYADAHASHSASHSDQGALCGDYADPFASSARSMSKSDQGALCGCYTDPFASSARSMSKSDQGAMCGDYVDPFASSAHSLSHSDQGARGAHYAHGHKDDPFASSAHSLSHSDQGARGAHYAHGHKDDPFASSARSMSHSDQGARGAHYAHGHKDDPFASSAHSGADMSDVRDEVQRVAEAIRNNPESRAAVERALAESS